MKIGLVVTDIRGTYKQTFPFIILGELVVSYTVGHPCSIYNCSILTSTGMGHRVVVRKPSARSQSPQQEKGERRRRWPRGRGRRQ